MKTKLIMIVLAVVLITVGFLTSCELINDFIESRTRPISVVQLYNSNLEKTFRMSPNDTMYAEVRGLEKDTMYTVQVLDAQKNVISELTTFSDEEGIIHPSPLWYDIGFKVDAEGRLYFPNPEGAIDVKGFYVRVFDDEEAGNTDFTLEFFVVFSTTANTRPQPIVMAGKMIDNEFFMENAFYSEGEVPVFPGDYPEDALDPFFTDELYVKVENLTPITDVPDTDAIARIWILPFSGKHYQDGDQTIALNAWFYEDFTVEQLKEGVKINWPYKDGDKAKAPTQTVNMSTALPAGIDSTDKIPKWAEEQPFTVFLDMMDRGIPGVYNVKKNVFAKDETESKTFFLDSIDGNGVPGFIVRKPPETDPIDFVEMELASTGIFRWTSTGYDYGYRNEFKEDGTDTLASFWYNVPLGIKVIWNPYLVPAGWNNVSIDMPENFYWGRSVDVYVVSKDHYDAIQADNDKYMEQDDFDFKVKIRVPIQSGCGNGLRIQTVWRAPMVPGVDYRLIVDMDGEGKLSENSLVHKFDVTEVD